MYKIFTLFFALLFPSHLPRDADTSDSFEKWKGTKQPKILIEKPVVTPRSAGPSVIESECHYSPILTSLKLFLSYVIAISMFLATFLVPGCIPWMFTVLLLQKIQSIDVINFIPRSYTIVYQALSTPLHFSVLSLLASIWTTGKDSLQRLPKIKLTRTMILTKVNVVLKIFALTIMLFSLQGNCPMASEPIAHNWHDLHIVKAFKLQSVEAYTVTGKDDSTPKVDPEPPPDDSTDARSLLWTAVLRHYRSEQYWTLDQRQFFFTRVKLAPRHATW